MLDKIIAYSIGNRLMIGLMMLGLVLLGINAIKNIPLDAVPDITNNQVQIVTSSPTLAPQEVEQFITYPVEAAMANIPKVTEIRSISRYGLSVVTVVFEESMNLMLARQFVAEQLKVASSEIPISMGEPSMMPITTGLGEIYQYVLTVKKGYESQYDAMQLRTIQDWIVKRQMQGIEGIVEISSFGGFLKQYEVAVNPALMRANKISMEQIHQALAANNENSGGSYLEKGKNSFYIRTEGRAKQLADIEQIIIKSEAGIPIRIKNIAQVRLGSAKRYGAMTMDGKGEVVGGITLMLKGANSSEAVTNVKNRIEMVQKSLPEGVEILPYLDRSKLVDKAIRTVSTNLLEGGLIVIFVLVLLLGNIRAGLVVASVIPFSMLFALILMDLFGVSANLMSLGAIDFGIVIDGAVIIVESVLHYIYTQHIGKKLTTKEMNQIVQKSTANIYQSAAFGVLIILVVFVPILTLQGVEGKMFAPMAQTVSFAIIGSLLLSLTYVPMMTAWVLKKEIKAHNSIANRIMGFLRKLYLPALQKAMALPAIVFGLSLLLLAGSLGIFSQLGSEFIPTLEEGDLAMQMAIPPGSSLQQSVKTATAAEKILIDNFPEVKHVVSKIGTAEVPTDPMAIEDADVMIILKEKADWVSATNREDLADLMKAKLEVLEDVDFEFTQPIQLRFNELMTGAKADVAVKIFGEDVEKLKELGDIASSIISPIQGAADVKVEQTEGLRQLNVKINRTKLAQYGLNVADVNLAVRAAYAGETAGAIYEEERKFDLVIRLQEAYIQDLNLSQLFAETPQGQWIPLSEVAEIVEQDGPMQISREDAKRRIVIGINVRNRDVASLVAEISQQLDQKLALPPGYFITYGGQFENLQNAVARLKIAVPVSLGMIIFLLYLTFNSFKKAMIIFIAVPFAAVGGVLALQLRGMEFSISAGVGFIALFGVAVLNGIVLVHAFGQLKIADFPNFKALILEASTSRLRPVLMTATVASLGFLPMALSTSGGAEVQKPLATVVIGGLVTSTLLTLFVLPTLYYALHKKQFKVLAILAFFVFLGLGNSPSLQAQSKFDLAAIKEFALSAHPDLQNQTLQAELEASKKKQAFTLAPTDFSYQFGQINYGGFDNFLQASQNLGNPFELRAKKDLADGKIEAIQHNQSLSGRLLLFKIASQYEAICLQAQLQTVHKQEVEFWRISSDKAKNQFNAGEISEWEFQLFKQKWQMAEQQLAQSQANLATAQSELKTLALLPDSASIRLIPLTENRLGRTDSLQTFSGFTTALDYQKSVLELEKQVILASKKPSFQVGYFHQSLEKDWGFQGGFVGVSVPIFATGKKQDVVQNDLRQAQVGNQKAFALNQAEQALRAAWQNYQALQAQISNLGSNYPEQLAKTRTQLAKQWELGEMEYATFAQLNHNFLDAELRYFQTLGQLNQAARLVEYWAE